jgi:hypothetical protein
VSGIRLCLQTVPSIRESCYVIDGECKHRRVACQCVLCKYVCTHTAHASEITKEDVKCARTNEHARASRDAQDFKGGEHL